MYMVQHGAPNVRAASHVENFWRMAEFRGGRLTVRGSKLRCGARSSHSNEKAGLVASLCSCATVGRLGGSLVENRYRPALPFLPSKRRAIPAGINSLNFILLNILIEERAFSFVLERLF